MGIIAWLLVGLRRLRLDNRERVGRELRKRMGTMPPPMTLETAIAAASSGEAPLERDHLAINCRAIGYAPSRAHWLDPYFAKSSTFASTKWLFCSISCRD